MKKTIAILLLILTNSLLFSRDFSLDISSAQFYYDEDYSQWNLYYSFNEKDLTYTKENDKFLAKLQFKIKFYSNLKLELEDEWTIGHYVSEINPESDIKLFGLREFKLKEGQYKVELSIKDLNDENVKNATFDLLIRNIGRQKLEMSDIVLCNLILDETNAGIYANHQFFKNSLYIYPNPSAEIYGNNPVLKTYFEIYNAKTYAKDGLMIHYYIYDGAQREVFYYPKSLKSLFDGMVEKIELPLSAIPTGVYTLVVAIKGINTYDSIFTSKKFYLVNYDMPPVLELTRNLNSEYELSEFATMTEEQLDLEFKQASIIAEKEETAQYKLLTDPTAKAKFLFNFWHKRNTDTTKSINIARYDFIKRIDYANRFFSWGGLPNGWETDRGRVYLKYGEPTRRDYFHQRGNERSYESWFYSEIEGGVYFYFVDVGGFGNFQQVHSTKSGEIYNENWFELYVPITKENRQEYRSNEDNRRFR